MTTRDFLFPHNTYISSRSNTRTVLLDRTKHFKVLIKLKYCWKVENHAFISLYFDTYSIKFDYYFNFCVGNFATAWIYYRDHYERSSMADLFRTATKWYRYRFFGKYFCLFWSLINDGFRVSRLFIVNFLLWIINIFNKRIIVHRQFYCRMWK